MFFIDIRFRIANITIVINNSTKQEILMTEETPKDDQGAANKKANKLTKIFAAVTLVPLLGILGYVTAPHSDRKNAEKTLKSMGYTIVEYEGTTWAKGRDKGDFYTDEFKVIPPGQKNTIDVVVGGSSATGKTIKLFP
jgi:hypothetical protein